MLFFIIIFDVFLPKSKWIILSYDRWDFRVWTCTDHWPLKITWEHKIYSSHESPYMTSYLTSFDTFSLSRTVFDIFDLKVFRVWPWPLTSEDHRRSEIFSPFESPYISNFYWHLLSISYGFEIFGLHFFKIWPWPLTFKGHRRSKKFSQFESSYMTSYLTSIDTFYLSRTVFEIFHFKVLRVWPWPLTFRGHLRSKIFQLFENLYMIPYLSSIDTFSLSRTVFEIFDFEVFKV